MKKISKIIIGSILVLCCLGIGTYYFLPGVFLKTMVEVAKWRGGIETQSIQVGSRQWPYLQGGTENSEAIVFIHGFGSSKEPWVEMMGQFSDTYHVVAPDVPGFGENLFVEGESYTISSQVERLNHFFTAIGVTRFHLIGVSMGGWISAQYASTYPDKVISLALMDAAGVVSPEKSFYVKHLEETGENLLVPEDVEGFQKMMEVVYYNPPSIPNHIAQYFLKKREQRVPIENAMFEGMVKSFETPLEQLLPKISSPTLILWGEEDRIIDVSSVPVFEKGIKDHKTVILKNIGHAPFMEDLEKTNEVFQTFLTNR